MRGPDPKLPDPLRSVVLVVHLASMRLAIRPSTTTVLLVRDVRREQRGRGIGSRLVEFVEERAARKGRRAVTLGRPEMRRAFRGSRLAGGRSFSYSVTGEEENAYTHSIGVGVSEIRMRKRVLVSGIRSARVSPHPEEWSAPVTLRGL